jgi:hypothetical protein
MQNRVDPIGNIISTTARGSWMGNRGLLHSPDQQILRPFKLKAWITCVLQFKGRKRVVMSPNLYTELFFLDEATAFAAGHRPCCECRRQEFNRFKTCWIKGNQNHRFNLKTPIRCIDDVLHAERIHNDRSKVTFTSDPADLPSGTFVLHQDEPFLIRGGSMHRWSSSGYDKGIPIPNIKEIPVLTPRSIVNTFREGYIPGIAQQNKSI